MHKKLPPASYSIESPKPAGGPRRCRFESNSRPVGPAAPAPSGRSLSFVLSEASACKASKSTPSSPPKTHPAANEAPIEVPSRRAVRAEGCGQKGAHLSARHSSCQSTSPPGHRWSLHALPTCFLKNSRVAWLDLALGRKARPTPVDKASGEAAAGPSSR